LPARHTEAIAGRVNRERLVVNANTVGNAGVDGAVSRFLSSSNCGPIISESSFVCSSDVRASRRKVSTSGDAAPASNSIAAQKSFNLGC
jgi:hypothetical protein